VRLVTVKLPEIYVEGIEELVRAGRYTSRSEAIRAAVRILLARELWRSLYAPPLEELEELEEQREIAVVASRG
jgi:antitoxin ParD1/3/4